MQGSRLQGITAATMAALVLVVAAPASAQTTHTIAASAPNATNSLPFGCSSSWGPFFANFYKNVPAFELKPGDTLAFDLIALNDNDIQLDIALAPTTTNGGMTEAQPFTNVVSNAQIPANPRGDSTEGTYELQFLAEAPFSFPGGGLILRFSNPGGAFASDASCTGTIRTGPSTDPSGFLVQRTSGDTDGVSPWENLDTPGFESVGGFRLIIADVPQPGQPGQPESQAKADRTLTLEASKSKVKEGRRVTLSGRLDAPQKAACESGQTVELQRKKPSKSSFTTFDTVQTDAQGTFSTKEKVKKTYEFRAQVTETAACESRASDSERVRVKKN